MEELTPRIKETIPVKGIRRIIAQRMRTSLDTAAQAAHCVEVNVSEVMHLKDMFREQGCRVTVTDILLKAAALSLKKLPTLNSTMEENHIVLYEDIHIALAIAAESGLVTPVLRHVDMASIPEIGESVRELARKAKEAKLSPDDFVGGTFTVSNLGMYGIDQFTAIINPPQAGILAIAAAKKKVVVGENNEIQIRPMMNVTLTYDHRIVDGAPAAQFLQVFKVLCEGGLEEMQG